MSLFNTLYELPVYYGNPGNVAVAVKFKEYGLNISDSDLYKAENVFRIIYPKYKEEGGWLHILHKNICKYDVIDTYQTCIAFASL